MNTKEKLTLIALALLTYLIPFSSRVELLSFKVVGTDVINDFTRVFLFGADVLAFVVSVFLIVTWKNNWSKQWAAMTALVLFIIMAWAGAWHIPLGAAALIRLIIAGLIVWSFLKTPHQLLFPGLAIGLIIGGMVQSVFAVVQFIAQKGYNLFFLGESPLLVGEAGVSTFQLFGERVLRAYGSLPHPNILAFYLTISLLATLIAIKFWPNSKKLLMVASIIISLGLLVTFSRLFVVLLALLIISGLIFLKQKLTGRYLAPAIAIVIAVIGVIAIRGSDQSYNLRENYSEAYSEMAKASPWRGIGLGQSAEKSKEVIQKTFRENYEPWMHQPVHSTYALVKTETGWLGLGLFILFLIFVDLGTMHRLKNNPPTSLIFAAGAFFLIIIAMFFEHLFITNPNSLYLSFAVFGLLLQTKTAD